MIKVIEELIWGFRSCFSRQAAFYWFLIIIMGFIVRFDHLGVTSFVRWLFLRPECYELILHFFRSTSWNLDCLLQYWAAMAVNHYPLIKFNYRPVLIGDGTKVSKEAKKMPAVKWLHQDSENSGKAKYINGHHFGFVGLLVGSLAKAFCLPLHGQLHEGTDGLLRPGKEFAGKPATIVTRMAYLVLVTAKHLGCLCYVTLDAYFATGPAFLILKTAVNEKGEQWVHLITRAKDNYVAYYDCADAKKRFQKENKIQLMSLFNSPEHFQKVELMIYGQLKIVEYYCANLFWKPVNDLIRFVLVRDEDRCYILMCSDLNLCPTQIITVYSYRWKIEVMFLMLKQFIGGFCYHFWTKAFPLLERSERIDYCKLSDSDRKKLDRTVEAIERFVNLASIALGLLQYLALTYASEIWKHYHGWLRTYSSEIPSERIVQSVIQTEFFSSLGKVPVCRTLRLILEKSRPPPLDWAA